MTDGQKEFIHTSPLPLIRVSGTHREMGRQIGEASSEMVRHNLENAHRVLDSAYEQLQLSWDGAIIQARKYMPFAQERYPQYVEELAGIAEGAGISFDDIAVVNAMEAVTMDALHLTKCTSLAISGEHTADEHVLVGHNEDWLPEDEPDAFIIAAKPDDELPFMAMTYGGLLPNIGFNAEGIAQCCDSVHPLDRRIGIPRVILSRAVLSARTPAEAIRHTLAPLRAAGYNHLLAHKSGEMYNVEVSARRFALLYGEDGYLVHTNHYLDFNMQSVEDKPDELINTRVRYFRAMRLLKQTEKHTHISVQSILKDHVNFPESICRHDVDENEPLLDREKTIVSLVMDLSSMQMYVAWGAPCANKYHTYQLDM